MHVNTVNTYACNSATKNSKAMIAKFIKNGNAASGNKLVPAKITTKAAKIFNIAWPATMFAKRRTERLIGLVK